MSMPDAPLVVHAIHHLVIGGMENSLVNLINNMPASGYRHAIVCVEDYSEFKERLTRPDVDVIPLFRSKIGVWAMRREMYRLFRRLKPAIVHSRNMSGLDAVYPARLAGVPCVIHGEHGWDVHDLDGTNRKAALLRKLHAPGINHYITVSGHLKHYLEQRIGIAPDRITRICNGVDTARFRPRASDLAAALPEGFRGDDKVLIGTVGRIQPVKDQETLVRAIARLVEKRPGRRDSLRLVIVGDGPLYPQLRETVRSLGIDDLAWLPGSTSDVPDVLRALDVFVLPSLAEGISNTVLEAMGSGLPVVATATGGTPELVEDGRYGFLFPPGNPEALADILERYIDNPDCRREHGARARERAETDFSLSAMVAQYGRVYDRFVVAGR